MSPDLRVIQTLGHAPTRYPQTGPAMNDLDHQNKLRAHIEHNVTGTVTRINAALDAMNYTELRNAARRAIIAQAYQNADPDGNPEHESNANDHLMMASTFDMDQERKAFREEQIEAGLPDDVAEANWYRRLLNIVPLDADGCETDPNTFKGWDA